MERLPMGLSYLKHPPMNPFHDTATASHQMSRRQVLRGLGTVMSLPFLETFAGRASAAAAPVKAPLRAAWLYLPNGVNVNEWFAMEWQAIGSRSSGRFVDALMLLE